MKKIAIAALLLLFAVGAQAQNNVQNKAQNQAQKDEELAKIRKLYANTKTMLEKGDPENPPEMPLNITTVNSHYIAPGAGEIKEEINYYYHNGHDEDTGEPYYFLYFISRKYVRTISTYYEEFLYDDDLNLVFYFCQKVTDTGKETVKEETRYYWGKDGLITEIIKGGREMDDVFTQRLAYDLKEGFNRLLNREY